MILIYFTFFYIVSSNADFARSQQKMPTEALWAKLKAYQNATGISTEKMISIWERSQEFSQDSSVKGKPLTNASLSCGCKYPK